MNVTRVFVYGTLLPGQRNHGVIAPYIVTSRSGRVGGQLVDVGSYPALLPNAERTVRGIWMTVTLEAIPGLDELEGFIGIEENNDYERVWVTDAGDPDVAGWLYLWTHSRGYPFLDTDWWPDKASNRD